MSRGSINFRAFFDELLALFFHAGGEGVFFGDAVFGGVLADVLADLHEAEVRAAHGAEVSRFRAVLGEGFVVEFADGDGGGAEVELVFPAELEAGLAEGVVAVLGAGVAFGDVGGVVGEERDHRPEAGNEVIVLGL
jgi:hypothetical protein